MFSFRPLSGYDFAWAAAWRTGLFTAASLLFTPAILSLRLIFDCSGMHGPCFSTALFMLFWVKPAIYVAFIVSFVPISIGRARHAGLPPALAVGVILMLFADMRFGTALGFATGNNMALMGFWGSPEPALFLPALAAVGTLCVLRGSEPAPEPWRARLGGLGLYAVAVVAILYVAAGWLALQAAGAYVPGSIWLLVARPLAGVAGLAPLLLLPIGVREWRRAGQLGRDSAWFHAVVAAVVLMCAASAVSTANALLLWATPHTGAAFVQAMAMPINALKLAALLGALSLPALIAKMLEGRPSALLLAAGSPAAAPAQIADGARARDLAR